MRLRSVLVLQIIILLKKKERLDYIKIFFLFQQKLLKMLKYKIHFYIGLSLWILTEKVLFSLTHSKIVNLCFVAWKQTFPPPSKRKQSPNPASKADQNIVGFLRS